MAGTAAAHHADRVLAVLGDPQPNAAAAPSDIAASWRRCLLNHRLDPERADPPVLLSEMELRHSRDYAGRLLRAADPELGRLHALVDGLGYSVLLADTAGAIVARRMRDSDEDGCRKWHLRTGAAFFSRHLILALPDSADTCSVPLLALDADRRIVGATHAARVALQLDEVALDGSIAVGDLLDDHPSEPASFADAERAVVTGALLQAQGNVKAAAASLGISRATLHRKIRSLRLKRPNRGYPA